MESSTKESTVVKIVYECSGTQLGESVFLCGSLPQIGSWGIGQSLEMHTNNRLYPRWVAKLTLPPGLTFEYKYVVADSKTRNVTRWEVLPYKNNRILTVSSCESITIFEREGMYERSIEYAEQTLSSMNRGSKIFGQSQRASQDLGFINEVEEDGKG